MNKNIANFKNIALRVQHLNHHHNGENELEA